jgi:hypothetical protein
MSTPLVPLTERDHMINEAFFNICREAKPAKSSYVSLYVNVPYYGGPEEGGWWGSDNVLVAYHQCGNDVEAEHVKAKVEELAKEMSDDAKRSFGRACIAQCEWLEARGLDSDSLPEVDGEESYFVVVEDTPGEHASNGCRHYE